MKILNQVMVGITQALDAEFEEMPKYIDEVDQELEESCFLVNYLVTAENHVINNRYDRSYSFMVQYFPKEKDYRKECGIIEERLLNCLEYIQVDSGTIRGTDMSTQVVNGVLNFEVTYAVQMFKKRGNIDAEVMGHIETEIAVKE